MAGDGIRFREELRALLGLMREAGGWLLAAFQDGCEWWRRRQNGNTGIPPKESPDALRFRMELTAILILLVAAGEAVLNWFGGVGNAGELRRFKAEARALAGVLRDTGASIHADLRGAYRSLFRRPGKISLLVPPTGTFWTTLVSVIIASFVILIISSAILSPNTTFAGKPLTDVERQSAYHYLLAAAGAVFVLAALILVFTAPGLAVFDQRSKTLTRRRLFRRPVVHPLEAVAGITMIRDREGGALNKRFYHVLTFRKEFMVEALRLGFSKPSAAALLAYDAGPITEALGILAEGRRPHSHPEAPPMPDPIPEHWWTYSGRRHYRLYRGAFSLFWRLVLRNALVAVGLLFAHPYAVGLAHSLREAAPDLPFDSLLVVYGVYGLAAAFALVNAIGERVGLRMDSEDGSVALYRCLGLWRTNRPFSDFEGFFLSRSRDGLELSIRLTGLGPLRLSGDDDPGRLVGMLVDTARRLGVDPWEYFHPHPYRAVVVADLA